jgi:suppressor of cytokine signaling 2
VFGPGLLSCITIASKSNILRNQNVLCFQLIYSMNSQISFFIAVSLRTSTSMCIKKPQLSPNPNTNSSNPNPKSSDMVAPSTVVIKELEELQNNFENNGEKKEKKVPYQNVTLAGTPLAASKYVGYPLSNHLATSSSQFRESHSQSSNLFQLEDKKAESQSQKTKKRHEHLLLQHGSRIEAAASDSTELTSSTASLLSGGCVINLMSTAPVITVHHHHHHHFDDNNGQMTSITTLSPEIPSSNLATSSPTRLESRPKLDPLKTPAPSSLPQIQSSTSVTQTLAPSLRNLQSNRNANVRLSNIIHQCLYVNKQLLEQCGFYYGAINWSQSTELLQRTSEGTFLVRDSSDSRFLYTLSVQRKPEDGPTSVRIHFAYGKFRLDADEQIEDLMPKFDSVLDLVNYYTSLSQNNRAKSHIWIDRSGTLYSPICLKRPLRKEVPSLAHAARVAVHQSLKSQDSLPELKLPNQISNFLSKYPHGM